MRSVLLAAVLTLSAGPAWGQACDSGVDADCDGDGYTVADGDCDDTEEAANPGESEECGDRIDNDCDGYFDEDCDQTVRLGSLRGGGGCTGGSGIDGSAAFGIALLPLALLARRRRS